MTEKSLFFNPFCCCCLECAKGSRKFLQLVARIPLIFTLATLYDLMTVERGSRGELQNIKSSLIRYIPCMQHV